MKNETRIKEVSEAESVRSRMQREWCFGCGQANPIGLKLKKMRCGDIFWCDFKVEKQWCGYPGILHGGIQAAIFDEIMGDAVNNLIGESVTLDMSFEFISPGRLGSVLRCSACIVSTKDSVSETRAEFTDRSTGTLISTASGRYKSIDIERLIEKMK